MKKSKKGFVILLILCLLPIIGIAKEEDGLRPTIGTTRLDNSFKPLLPSYIYTPHDSIVISQDSDFDAAHGVVSGTGIEGDPFIIENWNITVYTEYGIIINNTSAYFIIRNCGIFSEPGNPWFYFHRESAIYLINTANGTALIENNVCVGDWIVGCEIYNSFGSTIVNNTLENGLSIFGNLDFLLSLSVENNTVYDLPLGFYSNQADLSFTTPYSFGQLIFVNCTGVVIRNQLFSNRLSNPIALYFCSSCQLEDNLFSNNAYSINLVHSNNNYIVNNTCSNEWGVGIILDESNSNTLVNNNCSGNDVGITLYASDNNDLTNNHCLNNWWSIKLTYSNDNSLENNLCNGVRGIILSFSNNI